MPLYPFGLHRRSRGRSRGRSTRSWPTAPRPSATRAIRSRRSAPRSAPVGGETVLIKSRGQRLRRRARRRSNSAARGVEWLFVAGVWTEACIDATREAMRSTHGFRVILVKDACGSGSAAMHQTAILNLANRLYGGAVDRHGRRLPADSRRDGRCVDGRGLGAAALHLRECGRALRRALSLLACGRRSTRWSACGTPHKKCGNPNISPAELELSSLDKGIARRAGIDDQDSC